MGLIDGMRDENGEGFNAMLGTAFWSVLIDGICALVAGVLCSPGLSYLTGLYNLPAPGVLGSIGLVFCLRQLAGLAKSVRLWEGK